MPLGQEMAPKAAAPAEPRSGKSMQSADAASAPGTGNFARELMRQCAFWHLRKFYAGTELEAKLSELDKLLTF